MQAEKKSINTGNLRIDTPIIKAAAEFASKTSPRIMRASLEMQDKALTIVTTDSISMFVARCKIVDYEGEDFNLTFPMHRLSKAVKARDVVHLAGATDDRGIVTTEFHVSDRDGTTRTMELVSDPGSFVNWRNIEERARFRGETSQEPTLFDVGRLAVVVNALARIDKHASVRIHQTAYGETENFVMTYDAKQDERKWEVHAFLMPQRDDEHKSPAKHARNGEPEAHAVKPAPAPEPEPEPTTRTDWLDAVTKRFSAA